MPGGCREGPAHSHGSGYASDSCYAHVPGFVERDPISSHGRQWAAAALHWWASAHLGLEAHGGPLEYDGTHINSHPAQEIVPPAGRRARIGSRAEPRTLVLGRSRAGRPWSLHRVAWRRVRAEGASPGEAAMHELDAAAERQQHREQRQGPVIDPRRNDAHDDGDRDHGETHDSEVHAVVGIRPPVQTFLRPERCFISAT